MLMTLITYLLVMKVQHMTLLDIFENNILAKILIYNLMNVDTIQYEHTLKICKINILIQRSSASFKWFITVLLTYGRTCVTIIIMHGNTFG